MPRVFLYVSLLFTASFAFAYPTVKPGMSVPPQPLVGNYDYEGIVQIDNCSGSFVRFENAQDSDRGLVLTNGHCLELGFPDPGEFVVGHPSRQSFSLLKSNGRVAGDVRAEMILYATMTGTDMTLYRLRETYAEITSRLNVRPLILSSEHPSVNQAIEIISGYWVRGFSCAIEAFVYQLREDSYTTSDSIRFSRPGCLTYGGTSGSPIIATDSRKVIGVNNTGNESGGRCTINNPCEIDESGNVFYEEGYSYGQQTYWLYSCLTSSRDFDLTMPGCLLPH